jgi:hypothetical protein
MSSANKDEPKSKFQTDFGGVGSIGYFHQGDVHAHEYKPQISNQSTTTTITIDNRYVKNMPEEYASSLARFAAILTEQLNKESIPETIGAPIQAKINELAKETTTLEGGINDEKKNNIRDKLHSFVKVLVKASPRIARAIIPFTPLAPFADLIGESFESIVEAAMQSQ